MIFKNYTLFLSSFFFLLIFDSFGQSKDQYSSSALAEKIYLQLDNSVYTTEDTILISGVVVNAAAHSSNSISSVLYVELIDANSTIIERKLFNVKEGKVSGYFDLDNKINKGLYLIRAYTNWNKNFDTDFIFKTYIQVYEKNEDSNSLRPIRNIKLIDSLGFIKKFSAQLHPNVIDREQNNKPIDVKVSEDSKDRLLRVKPDKDGNYFVEGDILQDTKKVTLELFTRNNKSYVYSFSPSNNYLDLVFYPENNLLVEGLACKVGFKALDANAKGIALEGDIIDENNAIISQFKSNDYGIGSFVLRNLKSDKRYKARVKSKDNEFTYFNLPEVKNQGIVVNALTEENLITLYVNSVKFPEEILELNISCRGYSYINEKVNLTKGRAKIVIDKNTLPEGVIHLELFATDNAKVYKRFIYNDNQNQQIFLDVSVENNDLSVRDKVKINVKAYDKNNAIENGNISVLVLPSSQENHDLNEVRSMRSFIMISSDFFQKIENIDAYFESAQKLDNLMLTLEEDSYKYKPKKQIFKFDKEYNLRVSGVIQPTAKKNKTKSIELLFMTFGKNKAVYTKEVPVPGSFKLDLKDMYAEEDEVIIVQPVSKNKDAKKEYLITFNKHKTPKVNFNLQEISDFNDEKITTTLKINRSVKLKEDEANFKYYGSTALDEVVIDAYKMTPKRQKMADKHGTPDIVIEEKEIKENTPEWHSGLYSVLLASFSDRIQIFSNNIGELYASIYGVEATLIVIDGIPVRPENLNLVQLVDPTEVTSVEILQNPARTIPLFLQIYPSARPPFPQIGILSIYTKSGIGLHGAIRKQKKPFELTQIPVFANDRPFDSPQYEDNEFDALNPIDFRIPIYWNPRVQINQEGNAEVVFYNSDLIGDFYVLLQASNDKGFFGRKILKYSVSEN